MASKHSSWRTSEEKSNNLEDESMPLLQDHSAHTTEAHEEPSEQQHASNTKDGANNSATTTSPTKRNSEQPPLLSAPAVRPRSQFGNSSPLFSPHVEEEFAQEEAAGKQSISTIPYVLAVIGSCFVEFFPIVLVLLSIFQLTFFSIVYLFSFLAMLLLPDRRLDTCRFDRCVIRPPKWTAMVCFLFSLSHIALQIVYQVMCGLDEKSTKRSPDVWRGLGQAKCGPAGKYTASEVVLRQVWVPIAIFFMSGTSYLYLKYSTLFLISPFKGGVVVGNSGYSIPSAIEAAGNNKNSSNGMFVTSSSASRTPPSQERSPVMPNGQQQFPIVGENERQASQGENSPKSPPIQGSGLPTRQQPSPSASNTGVDSWPHSLSPSYAVQFILLHITTIEWGIAVLSCIVACFRRCLVSVPFFLFFAYYVITSTLQLRGRKILSANFLKGYLFWGCLVALLYITCFLYFQIEEWEDGGGDTWQNVNISDAMFLVSAFHEPLINDISYFVILNVVFLYCISHSISLKLFRIDVLVATSTLSAAGKYELNLTTTTIDTGAAAGQQQSGLVPASSQQSLGYQGIGGNSKDSLGEEIQGGSVPPHSQYHPATTQNYFSLGVVLFLRKHLHRGRLFVNPILLFITATVTCSLLGILWAIFWVLSVLVDTNRMFLQIVMGWGLVHLLGIFLGGFQFVTDNYIEITTLGITFGNKDSASADGVPILAILLTLSFNAFAAIHEGSALRSVEISDDALGGEEERMVIDYDNSNYYGAVDGAAASSKKVKKAKEVDESKKREEAAPIKESTPIVHSNKKKKNSSSKGGNEKEATPAAADGANVEQLRVNGGSRRSESLTPPSSTAPVEFPNDETTPIEEGEEPRSEEVLGEKAQQTRPEMTTLQVVNNNTAAGKRSSFKKREDLAETQSTQELGSQETSHSADGAFAGFSSLAEQQFKSLHYIVRKYFYILAFFALFLAAIVKVNVLHLIFLIFFAIIVAWRPIPQMLWTVLVAYTVTLTIILYAMRAGGFESDSLLTIGFFSKLSSPWLLWSYFAWSTVFIVQFRIFRESNLQERSFAWTKYIPVVERLSASAMCLLNCCFLALITCTQQASIFGFLYLGFFLLTTTLVMLTSLHSPHRTVRYYWNVVVGVLMFIVFGVYLYQLNPSGMEKFFSKLFSPLGLTTTEIGLTLENPGSPYGLWPKIVSLMLCIVQSRVWRDTAMDSSLNPLLISTTAVDDGMNVHEVERLAFIVHVRHFFIRILKLVDVYSLGVAALFLFIASLLNLSPTGGPESRLYHRVTLANFFYFLLGCLVSMSRRVRSSKTFWRLLQIYSSCACVMTYLLQLPLWTASMRRSGWLHYIGLQTEFNAHEMWYSLCPSIIVFATVVVHANTLVQRDETHVQENGGGDGGVAVSMLGNEVTSTALVDAPHSSSLSSPQERPRVASEVRRVLPASIVTTEPSQVPPNDTSSSTLLGVTNTMTESVFHALTHPMQYFTIAGFHLVLFALYLDAILRIQSIYGPLIFLTSTIIGAIGRKQMRYGLRWTLLCAFVFSLMVFQYLLLLGMPDDLSPNFSISTEYMAYFNLSPSPWDVFLSMLPWIVADMERISLGKRILGFHWFWGLPSALNENEEKMLSMTDRLHRFKWRIQAARKHNALNLLKRLIPPPPNMEDFTISKRFKDQLRLQFYERGPLVVLIVVFIHAVYDATQRLLLTKLASLIICLIFVQRLNDLPWHGNIWWNWLLRFQFCWLSMKTLYNVPFLQSVREIACTLRYLGLMPGNSLQLTVYTYSTSSCTGDSFSVGDLVFHAIVVCLVWIQSANFERAEYALVLHRRHARNIEAEELGKVIRARRLQSIAAKKAKDRVNMIEREKLLEQARRTQVGVTTKALQDQEELDDEDYIKKGEEEIENEEKGKKKKRAEEISTPPNPANETEKMEVMNATTTTTTKMGENHTPPTQSIVEQQAPDDEMKQPPQETRPQDTRWQKMKSQASFLYNRWILFVDIVIRWLDRKCINHAASPKSIADVKRASIAPTTEENAGQTQPQQQNRFLLFFYCLYQFLFSYTDRLCYLVFCLQFALSPCLLNSVMPMSTLLYASVMNPRPHRSYWSVSMILFQLNILAKSILKVSYCEEVRNFQGPKRGGGGLGVIAIFGRTCTSDFYLIDTVMQLLCILCLSLHMDHLRRWGLWDDTELDTYRHAPPRGGHHDDDRPGPLMISKLKDSFGNLTRDEIKTGTDNYKFAFAMEMLSFLYMFFAYYKLVGTTDTLVESLKHSILPGGLAVCLIVFFFFIVIDRIIYLMRSVVAKHLMNVGEALLYHIVFIWWFVRQIEVSETFHRTADFGIEGALLMAIILYFLKSINLFLGCFQAKEGYFRYLKHLVFSGNYGTPEFIFYYAGRLIPFVFDLEVILDWTVTPTALKLPYFMKLEDVCHELYLLQADMEDTRIVQKMNDHKPELQYPKIYKYPLGITFFGLLSVVLLCPLLLYSSFSPVIQRNSAISLKASITVEGMPEIWASTNQFVRSDAENGADVWCGMNKTVTGLLERTRPSLIGLGFSTDTVQLLSTSNYSSGTWTISPPALAKMLQVLNTTNETVSLILQVEIRSSVPTASANPFLRQEKRLDPSTQKNLSMLLTGDANVVKLEKLYTPFLFNRPQNDFTFFGAPQPPATELLDCYLSRSNAEQENVTFFSFWCHTLFELGNPPSAHYWHDISPVEQSCLETDNCPNYETKPGDFFAVSSPYFVILSNAVLSVGILQSIGIVYAYGAFVFAIGRVLRFVVSGGAYRVTLEDLEDPMYLVNLIEYLFIARAQAKFQLEGEIYQQLMNTLRVTEVLEQQTRGGGGKREGSETQPQQQKKKED